jgi:uncharacterized protein (DUF2225 family)
LCAAKFKSSRVKRSKQHLLKRDSDFCVHYKGKNPDFYNVFVCPQCGYGFSENFKIPAVEKIKIIKTEIKPPADDLCGLRTVEQAIQAYQTALKCALLGEEREKRRNKRDMLNAFIKELSKQKGVISEFDEQLWYALIDKVTVYGEEDIRFKFKDGAVIRM